MAVVDVKSVYGTTIKQYYIGASTDTKPTDVQIGAKFLESDTNTTYIFGSDRTWVIDPEHQSLNKAWNPNTLEWERQTQPLVNISNASLFVELGSMDIQLNSINAKLTSQVSLQVSANSIFNSILPELSNMNLHLFYISNYLSLLNSTLSGISKIVGSIHIDLVSIEKQLDPLAKFAVGFIDANSATSYYGFQGRDGDWYTMRISNGSYLYYYNSTNFDTGWGSRATLSYNSFAGVF